MSGKEWREQAVRVDEEGKKQKREKTEEGKKQKSEVDIFPVRDRPGPGSAVPWALGPRKGMICRNSTFPLPTRSPIHPQHLYDWLGQAGDAESPLDHKRKDVGVEQRIMELLRLEKSSKVIEYNHCVHHCQSHH